MKLFLQLIFIAIFQQIVVGAEMQVNASSFGFDPLDATEALQKAIDSGAKIVVVDKQSGDWFVRPIRLRSNLELIIDKDVTIRAKKNEFKHPQDALFTAFDCRDVIIRGNGNSTLAMPREDYADSAQYNHSEWRFNISLRGCENVMIRDLIIDGSGGDGIYIGAGSPGKPQFCKKITLENLTVKNHYRQGISIIGAEDLLVRNCTFTATKGTPPACGIDFEPNTTGNRLVDCRIENCEFSGNQWFGILLVLGNLSGEISPPISITFKDCIVRNNQGGALRIDASQSGASPVQGWIRFINCQMDSSTGEAVRLNRFSVNGLKLEFRNCRIENSDRAFAPVTFGGNLQGNFGNIDLGDTLITDIIRRPAISVVDIGGSELVNITGSPQIQLANTKTPEKIDIPQIIKANAPDPILKNFNVRQINPQKIKPVSDAKQQPSSMQWLRGNFRFVQSLRAGETAIISFTPGVVGTRKVFIPIDITDPNGALHDRISLTSSEPLQYRIHARQDSCYTFLVRTNGNTLSIQSDMPGVALAADQPLGFFRSDNEWYFNVGARDTDVKIEILGEEPVKAHIYNEKNEKVAGDNLSIKGIRILHAKRQSTAKDVVWKLKLFQAEEDHRIRLGAPLLPLLFSSPSTGVIEIQENQHRD